MIADVTLLMETPSIEPCPARSLSVFSQPKTNDRRRERQMKTINSSRTSSDNAGPRILNQHHRAPTYDADASPRRVITHL